MIRRTSPLTAVAALLAAGAAARADIDVEVGNADVVSGTIAPATEVETLRFRVPADAVVTVKAKAAKKGPELHLSLRDPLGGEIRTADGKAAAIAGVVATSSGVHSVQVTSRNGVATGDYTVTVSWKSRPAYTTTTATLAPNDAATLPFTADAGASVTLSAKPARGSKATGGLVSLTVPDSSVVPLTGVSAKRTLAAGGDHVLAFRNAGATAGALVATAKVKPPKPSRRKVGLTSKVIDPGGALSDFATAGLVGRDGGTVSVPVLPPGQPGAEISGSAVAVPADALGAATTIVVATAPPLSGPTDSMGAGPTVFFGPEGTRFDKADKSTRATVTVPYDPAFDGATDSLQIFTRDAKGKVTVVPPPYTFDTATHTVSFATSHFSSFRALAPGGSTSAEILSYADVADAVDVCFAFEQTASADLAEFLLAENASKVVGVLRLSTTSFQLIHETWVGGGTLTADGTPRLQFRFQDPVVSVFALDDGRTWAATPTQIFLVGTDDKVTRFAGTGQSLDGGDNGSALQATFVSIRSVTAAPDGTVYVADAGAHRIRMIEPVSQTITAWAGTGGTAIVQDGTPLAVTTFVGPADIAIASDDGLWVADGARLRHLTAPSGLVPGGLNVTVAGDSDGATGSSGDGGPPLAARFQSLSGVSVFFDIANPTADELVVSDVADHTLRLVDLTGGTVKLVAGTHGQAGYSGDVSAAPGLMSGPTSVLALPGQVIFTDTGNGKVRTRIVGAGIPKR